MTRWFWWLGAVALLACALPWALNPGAGLSLNPADLAEWTSLNPVIRAQSPPLAATFLLRTPLLVVAALFGLAAGHSARWLALLLILVLAAAQLPPFEFVRDLANANYQQQALLAALTTLAGLLALFVLPRSRAPGVGAAAAIAGLAAAFIGACSAITEMRALGLNTVAGPGLGVYSAALVIAAALPAISAGIKKRRAETPPSEVL